MSRRVERLDGVEVVRLRERSKGCQECLRVLRGWALHIDFVGLEPEGLECLYSVPGEN